MTEKKLTKVVFIWKPREELKDYLENNLKKHSNVDLIFPEKTDEETLIDLVKDADIIVGWRPTKKMLETAENLRLHINPGVGVQHLIPLYKELNNEKIVLVNGHGNTYFTAQHAVALLLSLMNKIVLHHNWLVAKQWRKGDSDAASIPLRNRKVGLLGYGAINQKVNRFLAGFDVEFHILRKNWDKQHSSLPTPAKKYSEEELHLFLETVDTLIIAVPLTSKTENMITKKELNLLGKEGLLVNVARGPVVKEKDLYEALDNKAIAGAAIDVWYEYQPEPDKEGHKFPSAYPFYNLENVVLSPHRGASPFSDLKRWDEVIENISRFVTGESEFLNVVNIDEGY